MTDEQLDADFPRAPTKGEWRMLWTIIATFSVGFTVTALCL